LIDDNAALLYLLTSKYGMRWSGLENSRHIMSFVALLPHRHCKSCWKSV